MVRVRHQNVFFRPLIDSGLVFQAKWVTVVSILWAASTLVGMFWFIAMNERKCIADAMGTSICQQRMIPIKVSPANLKVGFLKTHKTASRTLQNIILRFGMKKNKVFAMPPNCETKFYQEEGWNATFQVKAMERNPWHATYLRHQLYDLCVFHSRWNKEEYRKLLGSHATFLTILRDPVTQFESQYSFFNVGKHFQLNIQEFIDKVHSGDLKHRGYLVDNRIYRGLNQQAFDLGLSYEDQLNETRIAEFVDQQLQTFSFAAITERFDESMVIVAEILNVPLSWVASIPIGVRNDSLRLRLMSLQKADHALYEAFDRSLDETIQIYGKKRFQSNLAKLRRIQMILHKECDLDLNSNLSARMFSSQECSWIQMGERSLIEEARDYTIAQWNEKYPKARVKMSCHQNLNPNT
ncbi:galactosylceramide sulfotransferase-like isoform X2 [Tigriopus californicus]|uniref:galactosylceramide sulfotransferase-like isoform X2 n=1 Tax=Tigriopus californicus TaxID=6832 RepID=UPI0027DA5CCD|nr:galactosylceramide sulfotransferase-like isoform X2 [Tigriopus californicus]